MTNNKSPFKKSLQPWFLFLIKQENICLWTTITIPCCCITTPLPWESIEPCLKPSFSVKMSSEQWCKMHPTLTSPIPSLIIIIVEILNDKKIFKFKTPTLQVWKLQNHFDVAVLIEDFSMVSRVQLQFPNKFRSEFCQMLSHEKYSKFNGQKGQQKFHLHPIKI